MAHIFFITKKEKDRHMQNRKQCKCVLEWVGGEPAGGSMSKGSKWEIVCSGYCTVGGFLWLQVDSESNGVVWWALQQGMMVVRETGPEMGRPVSN